MSPMDPQPLSGLVSASTTTSDLIALAYEAAAEPARWRDWFRALSAHVGHRASTLVIRGFGPTRYVSLDAPGSNFETINPPRVFEHKALSKASFSMAFVGGEIVEEWSRTRSDGSPPTAIQLFTDQTRSLEPSDRSVLRAILPHLHRALVLHFRLDASRREQETLSTCLDELSTGMLLLDGNARVMHANQAALDYLDGPYGLAIENGTLLPRDRDIREPFHRNLNNVTSGQGPSMTGQPLACGATLWMRGLRDNRAVAYIASDRQDRPIAPELLADAFRLSPAQARVGALFAFGRSVTEIADELGISVHTVRTHVKTLQHKTGTHRQATLIRRLLETIPKVNP